MEQQVEPRSSTSALSAANILVLEDSFFILMELEATLLEAGAADVQACRTVREALLALDREGESISAAILDIQLDSETSAIVAHRLMRKGIPFLFYTGHFDIGSIHADWPGCRVLAKPAPRDAVVRAVAELLAA